MIDFVAHAGIDLATRRRWCEPFDPRHLEQPSQPIGIGSFAPGIVRFPRWNHYLVKERGAHRALPVPAALARFQDLCTRWLQANGIDIVDRWAYLTVDTQAVPAGATQRIPGWHIDGMQGVEVPIKQVPDLTFVWSDALPTRFFPHAIAMRGFDGSRHDIHRWAQRALGGREELAIAPPAGIIRLIDPYLVHAGASNQGSNELARTFIRLSFSRTPVTSRKMTINPAAHYGHAIHTTSDEIPAHLI